MPDEPAYAELARIDPDGHGRAGYELAPGVAVRLSPRLMAMWCAICIAQPIMGMRSTSTLEMYLNGRGRKPLSVMMSK